VPPSLLITRKRATWLFSLPITVKSVFLILGDNMQKLRPFQAALAIAAAFGDFGNSMELQRFKSSIQILPSRGKGRGGNTKQIKPSTNKLTGKKLAHKREKARFARQDAKGMIPKTMLRRGLTWIY
jgi:hypothetical protein